MSQTVQVGGTTYTIPDQGDPPNWGTNLTPFFVALAAEVATAPAFFQGVAVNSTPVNVGTEQTYLVASNTLAVTLNLPAPVQNLWFAVKDSGFNAANNNITIHRYGTEKINGVAADYVISSSGGWYMFGCNGTDWFMLRNPEGFSPLNASNQIVLTPASGKTMTITAPAPAASNVITFPDLSTAWSVVGTQGSQTIGGSKTFSAAVAITPVTNQLILGATRTVTITAPTPATTSRTWTIPDITSDATFAALEASQTFTGTNSFTASTTTFGPGGTGSTNGIVVINGGSATDTGSQLRFSRNSVLMATVGLYGSVFGGTSENAVIYSPANSVVINNGGTDVAIFNSGGQLSYGTNSTARWINISNPAAVDMYVRFNAASTHSPILELTENFDTTSGRYWQIYKYANGGSPANALGFWNNGDKLTVTTANGTNIVGTTTNDTAASGIVGEPIRSSVTVGVSSTGTGQFFDVTSISLTAGDWDVTGQENFILNGATQTVALMAITSSAGNVTTGQVDGDNRLAVVVPTSANDSHGTIAAFRVSLSGTTTYYLKARMDFSAGTPKAIGRISARRVR